MALDGFLKIDGIDGECKDARHPKWINITGAGWGASNQPKPSLDGVLAGGTPEVNSFSFTQPFSAASVPMFLACATGRQIATMMFHVVLAHGDEPLVVMKAEFKDCLITKVQTSSENAEISEQVEVVFRSIHMDAVERNSDGPVSAASSASTS